MIKIKRIYNAPARDDNFRILVDRLWPRGISKDKAKIDLWLKDIAYNAREKPDHFLGRNKMEIGV